MWQLLKTIEILTISLLVEPVEETQWCRCNVFIRKIVDLLLLTLIRLELFEGSFFRRGQFYISGITNLISIVLYGIVNPFMTEAVII